MLERSFRNLATAKRFPDTFDDQLQRFTTSLKRQGYADRTVRQKLRVLTNCGQWLGRHNLAVTKLDDQLLATFLKHRKLPVQNGDPRTLQQFLNHLRRQNVVRTQHLPRDRSPLPQILTEYERHLRLERGLLVNTILQYHLFVRKFLLEHFRGRPFLLKTIKASDISAFVLRHAPNESVWTTQAMTTAFRSFFRFLFQKGEVRADLAAAVPTVANWRLSTVPRYLAPKEVKRVLKSCDLGTAIGRRNYAILLLLARLGLRAGEVVALQLEDINWRAGEILIRGKGLLHDRMPLSADVGKALASYLRRDRPACQTRRVFVRMRAPHRGFAKHSAVSMIVRSSLGRANLHPKPKGAHLLRHSLATSMLHAGATMREIGEVLRHRSPDTTEIYAKVNFDGLRPLAHPWPTGGAQ
jgi:site-specific recombinase XerD